MLHLLLSRWVRLLLLRGRRESEMPTREKLGERESGQKVKPRRRLDTLRRLIVTPDSGQELEMRRRRRRGDENNDN